MNMLQFDFAETRLCALGSGALWWPDRRLLVVSDLHLAKSDRIARRGGSLLPPYETRETLARLAADMTALHPDHVLCLGDSFDDPAGELALGPDDKARLEALIAQCTWTWISGNHDPAPKSLGGTSADDYVACGLRFQHIASRDPVAPMPEVSGHFHPKMHLPTRAGTVTRPAFLIGANRLILPAYGAYTGGMPVTDPALAGLVGPDARAVLTGPKPIAVPAYPRHPTVGRRDWPAGPPLRHPRGSSG